MPRLEGLPETSELAMVYLGLWTRTCFPMVAELSNQELLARVTQLAAREREATAALIAHLAELDARRLYLAEGYSSLFTYFTRVLHLAEHAAYGRDPRRPGPRGGSRSSWSGSVKEP